MVRRLDNTSVYDINNYTVVLQRIKNNTYGTPRYKATIFYNGPDRGKSRGAYNYTFTGHYYAEAQEAEFILFEHLK